MNNYNQALEILNGESMLKKTIDDLDIIDMCMFSVWLEEKWDYLKELLKEPIHEMQEMEYYQKLVNLYDSE